MSAADAKPLWRERDARRSVDVLGIGQNSYDQVARVDVFPTFASKTAATSFEAFPGGQIAGAVHACARLGLRASLVSSVGDDGAADVVLESLRSAGVDVSEVRRIKGAQTQNALILVHGASGERTVIWHRDARLTLKATDLRRTSIQRARALHLDGSDPDVAVWAAKIARRAGIPVVLDADHYRPELEPLLGLVDFPIVSREFAETYTTGGAVRDTLARLCVAGARLSVVTLGAIGALAKTGDRVIESPGFRVEPSDTTGAGDAFHGAFIWAVLAEFDAERALGFANAAGALCCREAGAQAGHPTRAELEAFLGSHEPIDWVGP